MSVSGSAKAGNSSIVLRLTLTTPSVISSSHFRREATPAAAMIFCNLCFGIFAVYPRNKLIIHKIIVSMTEITTQLVIGMKIRQFFEPNCRSPGSLNTPKRLSSVITRPTETTINPKRMRNFPICPGS